MHGTESERKTDVEHRFKPHRAVVDWFKECKQARRSGCTIRISVLRVAVWESCSDAINRLATQHPGQQAEA